MSFQSKENVCAENQCTISVTILMKYWCQTNPHRRWHKLRAPLQVAVTEKLLILSRKIHNNSRNIIFKSRIRDKMKALSNSNGSANLADKSILLRVTADTKHFVRNVIVNIKKLMKSG